MAKVKKANNNKIYFLVGFFILIAVFGIVIVKKQTIPQMQIQNYPTVKPALKTYHSDFLEITFNYPSEYNLEEQFGTITLKKSDGQIIIDRIGTNLKSLKYSEKDSKLTLNGLEAKVFYSKYADFPNSAQVDHKIYQIYKNYSVYNISTNTQYLYSDLDRIAQSFRYEP